MPALLNVAITTAVTALVSATAQLRKSDAMPASIYLQGNFSYGSGGTTANAWVQTSFDGGNVWNDVANFSFTTSSAVRGFNLSSLTPKTTQLTPTDATLLANTANDGLIGGMWRVKYTTTGTYAGGTVLRVDAFGPGMTT